MDREDFGHKASTGASVEVYYNVQGVADVALDGPVRKLDPALENAACKPGKTLFRRCRPMRSAMSNPGPQKSMT